MCNYNFIIKIAMNMFNAVKESKEIEKKWNNIFGNIKVFFSEKVSWIIKTKVQNWIKEDISISTLTKTQKKLVNKFIKIYLKKVNTIFPDVISSHKSNIVLNDTYKELWLNEHQAWKLKVIIKNYNNKKVSKEEIYTIVENMLLWKWDFENNTSNDISSKIDD